MNAVVVDPEAIDSVAALAVEEVEVEHRPILETLIPLL